MGKAALARNVQVSCRTRTRVSHSTRRPPEVVGVA